MIDNIQFNPNVFFSGGAGMFLQYHDIIKPTYLFALLQMLCTNTTYGLPFEIISNMSIVSLIEMYFNRSTINPLPLLDPLKKATQPQLDEILDKVMESDQSIYKLAPHLNTKRMINVCIAQKISFPIYVYTEKFNPLITLDCKSLFPGMQVQYLHGDLQTAINRCDQNFTYILSDIELLKSLAKILKGTCSHILLARDYRYNYSDFYKTLKYNLKDIANNTPYLRIGTTLAANKPELAIRVMETLEGGR